MSYEGPFVEGESSSTVGKVDNQLEEPFSLETLRAFCMLVNSLSINSEAACVSCCRQVLLASNWLSFVHVPQTKNELVE